MSDIQIPNLPPATDLTGAEQLEVVQAGVSRRATIAQIVTDANVPTASNTLPGMDGGASAGVEVTYSRGDHIHPTDTTRYAASNPANYVTADAVTAALGPYALIDSQAFTGTPSMPTGATGVTQTAADSSTKLATTAFVKAQGYAPTSSLGTMSVQNANAVAIIGGSINSTTVGATVASTGAFTTLSAVTSANFTTAGTVTINPTTLGHVDNTAVGATTPSTGAFTNLSASGTVSGVGFNNLLSTYAKIDSQAFTGTPSLPTGTTGITQATADSTTKLATTAFVKAQGYQTVAALGTMSTQNANAVAITGGTVNGTPVGATTASTGAFTNLSASGTVSGAGFTTLLAPYATTASLGTMSTQNANAVAITGGAINGTTVGATTASTGAFTTLSASGVVSGAGFTTLLTPYALVNSQVFTGTPSLPTGTIGVTQAAANNTTALATTAYVKSQNYLTANQTLTLSGDVTGSGTTAITATVVQLQGRPLAATAPTSGYYMGWNGSTWLPVAPGSAAAGGTNTQIQYNNGGLLGGISQNGSGTVVMTTGSAGVSHLNDVAVTGTNPMVALNKTATGGTCRIFGQTNSLARWQMAMGDSAAESTANLGSNFDLLRYDDAGVFIDTPFSLNRQSGRASFTQPINLAGISSSAQITVNAANANITLNKPASGSGTYIVGQTNAVNRWILNLGDLTAEGGSNAGSDFVLSRLTDAGGALDNPLRIVRSTGVATFTQALFSANHTITGAAGNNAAVIVNKNAAGFYSGIETQTAGSRRWLMMPGDNTAEGGSNAGSDFLVNRYSDTAVFIDTAFKIIRSTGVATFSQALVSGNHTINSPAATDANLILNKPVATQNNVVYGQKAGAARWGMALGNATAESGSDKGSDFVINNWSDAGAILGSPLFIHRPSGYTYLNGNGATAISATFDVAPYGHIALRMNKAGSGKTSVISGNNNGLMRWGLELGDSAAESTGNAGSNFSIARYNDAGTYIDAPLTISRSTGVVNVLQASINGGTALYRDSIELGAPAQNAAAFIDFHSSASSTDYDGRIITTGGTATVGSGTMQLIANGGVNISNNMAVGGSFTATVNVTAQASLVSTGGLLYLQPSGADAFINICDTSLNGGQFRTLAIRGLDASGTAEAVISKIRILTANTEHSGKVDAIGAFLCRAGVNGGLGGNAFSFNWAAPGQFNCYADTTYVGQMAMVSDYRTKKDVAPLASTWDRVLALNPISYTRKEFQPTNVKANEDGEMPAPLFTTDDTPRWGFVAHELQETLIDDAATGVKDDPEAVQSPNPWTVIAALTKALQEAMTRIEALEARP